MEKQNKRNVSAVDERLSCHKLLSNFKSGQKYSTIINFTNYSKFNNSLTFSQEELKLEKKIKYWANLGGRENSLEQMRHNGAFADITKSLNIDTPFTVARQARPLFYEAELSFYISKRAFRRIKILEEGLNELNSGKSLSSSIKESLISDYLVHPLIKTKLSKKDIEKGSGLFLKKKIESDIKLLNHTLIEYSLRLAKVYEDYSVYRTHLESVAKASGPKQADAKKVLAKLDTKRILNNCYACGDRANLLRPDMEEVFSMARDIRVTRIIYLETQLLYERILTVVALTPTNILFNIFDKFFEKIYWVNQTALRKWLRKTFLDHHSILKHFPNIDRIQFSDAGTRDLADLIHEFSVKSQGNDFLITYARRLDTQERFLKIYKWLGENASEDPLDHHRILFNKMTKARKEAANRGFLPEWHVPKLVNSNRLILETALLAAGTYGVYHFQFDTEAVRDGVNDLVGYDILKNEEYRKALAEEFGEERVNILLEEYIKDFETKVPTE